MSAELTAPSLLREVPITTSSAFSASLPPIPGHDAAANGETAEDEGEDDDDKSASNTHRYVWRSDLLAMKPFWNDWYTGVNRKFFSVRAPKILFIADVERMDTDMNRGNMQGLFQLAVVPGTGHHMHEDNPEGVAKYVFGFLDRYKLSASWMERMGTTTRQQHSVYGSSRPRSLFPSSPADTASFIASIGAPKYVQPKPSTVVTPFQREKRQ